MNKLLIKIYFQRIIEFLIFGKEFKAPEYAYVRVEDKPSNKDDIYDDTLRR